MRLRLTDDAEIDGLCRHYVIRRTTKQLRMKLEEREKRKEEKIG